MKKLLLGLLAVSVLVVSGLGYFALVRKDNTSLSPTYPPVTATPRVTATSFKKACDVLTQAQADTALGESSTKVDTSISNVVTAQASDTSCSYSVSNADTGITRTAAVQVRASTVGEAKAAFDNAKMSDAQTINDLGLEAYWSPTYGQINLLKGNSWIILSFGDAKPSQRTLAGSKPLAKLIIPSL